MFIGPARLYGSNYVGHYSCHWFRRTDVQGHVSAAAIDWAHYRAQQASSGVAPLHRLKNEEMQRIGQEAREREATSPTAAK